MAETGVTLAPGRRFRLGPVGQLRLAILLGLWALWEIVSASGILYRGVVPSSVVILEALWRLVTSGSFYFNLWVSGNELAAAMALGGGAGILVGLALGAHRFWGKALEPYLHYLGPTPKIVFLPVLIVMFGVDEGSKIAMGAISCFFPVALSVAAGVRGIDPTLVRVGRSFNARPWQMAAKVYLPALVPALINGFRLGLGVGIIGVLLAETVLSNRGLGFIAIDDYNHFDMPAMYAILIAIFALAILLNAGIERLGRRYGAGRR
ncbi:MAG TPA: ABC transporter permease [Alphaproteobacteria bacterium]|nr:ABC transporter permease [Alphaproteobacteria bacterium]